MEKRTIWVKPSCFTPEIEMIIPIPEDRDAEEYIDEFLDTMCFIASGRNIFLRQ